MKMKPKENKMVRELKKDHNMEGKEHKKEGKMMKKLEKACAPKGKK